MTAPHDLGLLDHPAVAGLRNRIVEAIHSGKHGVAADLARAIVIELDKAGVVTDEIGVLVAAKMTPKPAELQLHEDGIAQEFARRYAGKLVYAHALGAWYEWAGTHWRRDETRRAFEFCRELARELNVDAKAKWASAATAKGVEAFARADPALAVVGREFDSDPWLLGTPSGVVDLRTGAMRQARPDDWITRLTAVAPEPGTPERWFRFLDEATGCDDDLIAYLQRLAGYACVGEAREEALVFLWGDGGNGKGTFLGVLTEVLSEYARTAPMDLLLATRGERHPTDLASLAGARLVIAQESEEGRRWDAQRVKALTGRDTIAARFMRGDFFEFRANFTLIVASNHRPSIARVDEAWRRRLQLVPFVRRPRVVDPELKEKLRAEYPQILSWMIEGARNWLAQGLAPPEVVRVATSDYLADQDVVSQWVTECCDAVPSARTERKMLYTSLREWCESRGFAVPTLHTMTHELVRRGFLQDRTKNTRPICGIVIRHTT